MKTLLKLGDFVRFAGILKQYRIPNMIDNRELIDLCSGISHQSGDCTRLAGASDDQSALEEVRVIEALITLAERTRSEGVRLDLTPGLLDRLLGTPQPNRPRREWFLARKDLAFVWEAALQSNPSAIGLSLSHTSGAWLVAARALDQDASKVRTAHVGVDIEASGRMVTDRLLSRFWNRDDSCPGLTRIGLWAAKEALYKADPDSGARTLQDYAVALSVERDGFYRGTGILPNGQVYAACLAGNGRYTLAAAADTNPPTR